METDALIEVRLTENEIEGLLVLLDKEQQAVTASSMLPEAAKRGTLHAWNNLANKLALPLQKARMKRG